MTAYIDLQYRKLRASNITLFYVEDIKKVLNCTSCQAYQCIGNLVNEGRLVLETTRPAIGRGGRPKRGYRLRDDVDVMLERAKLLSQISDAELCHEVTKRFLAKRKTYV